MPSVSVPLKGEPGWDALMRKRRTFWAKPKNSELTAHFTAQEFYTHDGSPCPINARPAMVKLCNTYLEPMRRKFGVARVLSGYRHEQYNRLIGGARHSAAHLRTGLRERRGGYEVRERHPGPVGCRS